MGYEDPSRPLFVPPVSTALRVPSRSCTVKDSLWGESSGSPRFVPLTPISERRGSLNRASTQTDPHVSHQKGVPRRPSFHMPSPHPQLHHRDTSRGVSLPPTANRRSPRDALMTHSPRQSSHSPLSSPLSSPRPTHSSFARRQGQTPGSQQALSMPSSRACIQRLPRRMTKDEPKRGSVSLAHSPRQSVVPLPLPLMSSIVRQSSVVKRAKDRARGQITGSGGTDPLDSHGRRHGHHRNPSVGESDGGVQGQYCYDSDGSETEESDSDTSEGAFGTINQKYRQSVVAPHKYYTTQKQLSVSQVDGMTLLDGALKAKAALGRGTYEAEIGDTIETHAVISLQGVVDSATMAMPSSSVRLYILLDTSSSMKGYRLERAVEAVSLLIDDLNPGDSISIITFSDGAVCVCDSIVKRVAKQGTGGARPRDTMATVRKALRGIEAEGSTNMAAGLGLVLRLALKKYREQDKNHVLLLTDGHPDSIKGLVGMLREATDGGKVSLSAVGLGADFNEDLLLSLADAGRGSFYFAESAEDLRDQLKEEIGKLQVIVAHNVRVGVRSRPGVVIDDVFGYPFKRGGQNGWGGSSPQRPQGSAPAVRPRHTLPDPMQDRDLLTQVDVQIGDVSANDTPRDVLIGVSWTVTENRPGRGGGTGPNGDTKSLLDIRLEYHCPLTGHHVSSQTLTALIQPNRNQSKAFIPSSISSAGAQQPVTQRTNGVVRAAPAVDMVVSKVARAAVSKALGECAMAFTKSGDTLGLQSLQRQLEVLGEQANAGQDVADLLEIVTTAIEQSKMVFAINKSSPEFKKQHSVLMKRLKHKARILAMT
ncbi:hypothetical protein KIPB_001544 [Kipferlia bialata]|uniref:VWFA domain-containing protein n=1 Tax=Kipferlia bialata TaxID=797122 RepID=A0A9K3CQG5_9EUKA|nr:hypothetical protein KIPB_001544 [Kipferlia bialata]|eukprot:g1544.t1